MSEHVHTWDTLGGCAVPCQRHGQWAMTVRQLLWTTQAPPLSHKCGESIVRVEIIGLVSVQFLLILSQPSGRALIALWTDCSEETRKTSSMECSRADIENLVQIPFLYLDHNRKFCCSRVNMFTPVVFDNSTPQSWL